MAFCILTLTSVPAPPSSAKEKLYSLQQLMWYFENHNAVLLAYGEGNNTEFVCLRTTLLVLRETVYCLTFPMYKERLCLEMAFD
jgi:hypothetical protein